MRLQYDTYRQAVEGFHWRERWEVFDGGPEWFNIAHECIDRHPPERTAIRLKREDGRVEAHTFGEISRLTSRFANLIGRLGLEAGDRVAVVLGPSLEYYVSLFGALKAGAVAVPCYPLLGYEGINYRLRESGARMAVMSGERAELVDPNAVARVITAAKLMDLLEREDSSYRPTTRADSASVVQFTSGTTGLPKQTVHRHSAATVTAVYARFWIGLGEDDRYMCVSSPAWGHGIWYGAVAPLVFGTAVGALGGRFDPVAFVEALEELEITNVSAIPRVYRMVMESGRLDPDRLALRSLSYTGSAMDREVAMYFLDRLGIHIRGVYGNTEVGPVVLDYAFPDYRPRLGSAGKPMLRTRVGVLDEEGWELAPGRVGEVAVWRRDRWHAVGDLGQFDEDGYLWPKGRSDDVIKSSGYRIGPFEVESTLEGHPEVQKAAVVGKPDRDRGEIVMAFVVTGSPPTEALKRDIQEFVKTRLSMHEYPREIAFVRQIPETPDGKIRRGELWKQATDYISSGLASGGPGTS